MSNIDRILEKTIAALFGKGDVVQVEETIRAALIEYGAIVREECAKECERFEKIFRHKDYDLSEGSRQCAAAIRRMNDAHLPPT